MRPSWSTQVIAVLASLTAGEIALSAAFLDDATIESCIDHGRPLEIPPRPGVHYRAFIDPSGGRHDHFMLCIGHKEGSNFFVADVIRGRAPPFDPQSVVDEYVGLLRDYRIGTVTGDNYSAEWAASAFAKAGIRYQRSERNKSELYLEALPQFMRQAISIPDHPKLIRELRLLERRTSRMGRDMVDHGKNGWDDYANALCGALGSLTKYGSYDVSLDWVSGPNAEQDGRDAYQAAKLAYYLHSGGVIR
jgi:hypothetical protein